MQILLSFGAILAVCILLAGVFVVGILIAVSVIAINNPKQFLKIRSWNDLWFFLSTF